MTSHFVFGETLPGTRRAVIKGGLTMDPHRYASLTMISTLSMAFLGIAGAAAIVYFLGLIPWLLAACVAAPAITLLGFMAVPRQAVRDRRQNIDAHLWEAVSFMSVMAATGMQFPRIVKEVGYSDDYGAISAEFRRMYSGVDLLGGDPATALLETADRSASPNFEELLLGLVGVIFSGGHLQHFLDLKRRDFYEFEQKRTEQRIETFAALGESYLVVAVLLPLIMLVIVVSLGGIVPGLSTVISEVTPIVIRYGLPFLVAVYIMMVVLLDRNDLRSNFHPQEGRGKDPGHIRMLIIGMLATALTAGGLFVADRRWGLETIYLEPADIPVIAVIVFAVTYGTYAATTQRRAVQIERFYAEFLTSVAEKRYMGMDLPRATAATTDQHFGPLEPYLDDTRHLLDWHYGFDDVNRRLADNLQIRSIQKTARIVELAHETGGRIANVLLDTARGLREKLGLYFERNRKLALYVAVVYLGLGVLLFTSNILVNSFSGADLASLTGGQTLEPEAMRELTKYTAIVVGMGGAVVANMMSHRYAAGAFPHVALSAVIVLVAYKVWI